MTTKTTLFEPNTKEDNALILAAHMPEGRAWEAGFDLESNMGKFIAGLAVEFYRLQLLTKELSIEMDIDQTSELLIEWEKSVGIPNSYFNTDETIERRREQVKQLFTNFGGVQIAEDFVRVAAFFGITITVTAGADVGVFPLPFPIRFFGNITEVTHTIIIEITDTGASGVFFPLDFPLDFSTGGATFLQGIFDILAPANVQVIFI